MLWNFPLAQFSRKLEHESAALLLLQKWVESQVHASVSVGIK